METSLHRQLKDLYANDRARCEVPLGNYRIDVVRDQLLVEIQHGSLAAIRHKISQLLRDHEVLVVKPIVRRKRLIKRVAKGGRVVARRYSPKRGCPLDLFDELVYFTDVFPHRNLRLETPLVDIEEWRYPGHGRRRYRRDHDHQVEDQHLLAVHQVHHFHHAEDLRQLVPVKLPATFHSAHLASALSVPRWVAQRIAYCFRRVGTTRQVGKQGNTLLYRFA